MTSKKEKECRKKVINGRATTQIGLAVFIIGAVIAGLMFGLYLHIMNMAHISLWYIWLGIAVMIAGATVYIAGIIKRRNGELCLIGKK